MTPLTSVLAAAVVAEAAALVAVIHDLRKVHTALVCEELHGLALDQQVQILRRERL